jgi:hypothetical protein
LKLPALLVARLNEAGAATAGRRGKNCRTDVVDVVLPTLALTVCAVRSGIGVPSRVLEVQNERKELVETAFDGGNRRALT